MNTENTNNSNIYIISIGLLIISVIIIILSNVTWKQYKQLTTIQSTLATLEKKIVQEQNNATRQPQEALKLQSTIDTLQQQFNILSNDIKQTEATEASESFYELRATLRLTTLAAMHLFLGKDETVAKNLLTQSINKLLKMNDHRLNPILYNLQDEYTNLSNKTHVNYSVEEVWGKIDQIQLLVDKLEKKGLELDDFFAEPTTTSKIPTPTTDITPEKFLDLIKITTVTPNQDSKINGSDNNNNQNANYHNKLSYLKIEMLHIYLEQAKLAYLQNNDFLFKQTINSIKKILELGLWSPQLMLEIQEHLSWLGSIEIRTYPLLLQAILNLEDQLK